MDDLKRGTRESVDEAKKANLEVDVEALQKELEEAKSKSGVTPALF